MSRKVHYRLTSHAEKMLAERRILRPWIDRVLAEPVVEERDKEDPALRHALGPIEERGDRILRVVYNETVRPWVVVTAFFDRKAGKML
jgi:hypothetical protein